jgi:hypothetical protein
MADLTINGNKQTEVIRAVKHLLEMARSGRVVAIGFAVVQLDEDGDLAAGTNAVWTDERLVRDALKSTIATLSDRVEDKTRPIIMLPQ